MWGTLLTLPINYIGITTTLEVGRKLGVFETLELITIYQSYVKGKTMFIFHYCYKVYIVVPKWQILATFLPIMYTLYHTIHVN